MKEKKQQQTTELQIHTRRSKTKCAWAPSVLQQQEEITPSVFGGYEQINTSVTTHCCEPADSVSHIYDDSEDNFADPQTPLPETARRTRTVWFVSCVNTTCAQQKRWCLSIFICPSSKRCFKAARCSAKTPSMTLIANEEVTQTWYKCDLNTLGSESLNASMGSELKHWFEKYSKTSETPN